MSAPGPGDGCFDRTQARGKEPSKGCARARCRRALSGLRLATKAKGVTRAASRGSAPGREI